MDKGGAGKILSTSNPTGIRPVGSGIQIRFSWEKKRYEPIWNKVPNERNLLAAVNLRADIITRAKLGVLTWEYLDSVFPEYLTHVNTPVEAPVTFGHVAQIFLDGYKRDGQTRRSYKISLNNYWHPTLATRPIKDITKTEIRILINNLTKLTGKSKLIVIAPLRGVFNLAVADGLIKENPVGVFKAEKSSPTQPDPLSVEEADLIINFFYEFSKRKAFKYRAWGQYYEFAFYTGMRPSEILAITWADIDLDNKTAFVCKNTCRGVLNYSTKTGVDRIVHLSDRALASLYKMNPQPEHLHQPVFNNALSELRMTPSSSNRVEAFNRALKKLGIRPRSAYVTRHTFATLCLMAGVNPAFLAEQLGHSVIMLLKTYAKWLDSDNSKQEIAKIGKLLGNKNAADFQPTDK